MPCFYKPDLKIGDDKILITGNEYHHICHVFRKKRGDSIILSNGKGLLAIGVVDSLSKKTVTIKIENTEAKQKSQPEFAVAFPLLKNKHDNMIIEKLTELGVRDFFPITTIRTVRKPSNSTVDKFQKVAIAAMKQCDNAFLPKIHEVRSLHKLINELENYIPIAALEIGKQNTLNEIIANSSDKPVCLIIGPEGGFDDKEIEFLQINKVDTFTLGNHILRAETAAIASVSQLVSILLQNDPDYY